jgi:hypothetical protein
LNCTCPEGNCHEIGNVLQPLVYFPTLAQFFQDGTVLSANSRTSSEIK